ncbi:MAG: hypothetical protein BWX88_01165 [Planctomycetes bacterium ADurb.Bin126]|nr:MAG: hypothetical protein BWX88_01165 [Planctomycetes bacterium ADurb.Bin126]HOD81219.1 hypothetical protein [Phycisphaerae bacterium]HQL71783.1 hypothetical protein [Phycisphaerae bacterium]
MSSSTPDANKPSPSEFRLYHDRNHDGVWLAVSVLLHVGVLLALWLTPLRQILLPPTDPQEFQVVARADKIEEMVEYYRDRESEVLRNQLEDLFEAEQEMIDILDQRDEEYEELAKDLSEQAPQKALAAQKEALAAQQKALEAEAKAKAEQAELAQAKRQELAAATREEKDQAQKKAHEKTNQVIAAQAAAGEALAAVGDAQRKARQALAFAAAQYEPARSAQQKAEDAQKQASATQDQANENQEKAQETEWKARHARNELESAQRSLEGNEKRLADTHKRVERENQALADAKKRVDDANAKVTEQQQKLADTEQAAKQAGQDATDAEQAAKDAKKAADAARTPEKPKGDRKADETARSLASKAKTAQRAAESAAAKIESARKTLQLARTDAEKKAQEVPKAQARVEQAHQGVKDQEKKIAEARERLAAAQAKADLANKTDKDSEAQTAKDQQDAHKLQETAKADQQQAIAALEKAMKSQEQPSTLVQKPQVPAGQQVPKPTRPQKADLSKADIAQLYDRAVQAEQRVAEAYRHVQATEVAMIRNIPKADSLAQTVLPKTERPELNKGLLTGKVQTASGVEAHKQEVQRAEQEVDSMVAAAYRLLDKARGMREEEGGEGGLSGSLASIKAESARQAQLRELAAEDESNRHKDVSAAMQAGAAKPAASEGNQANPTPAGPGEGGKKPAYDNNPWPIRGRDPKVLPARRIIARADAHAADHWVYVDSWYTIGPFPNPRRRNIDTQFPPESVIDLDATYPGKDGRLLKWKFLKCPRADIPPNDDEPYGIYYAYTELFFEEAMDLHIAVGSDDNSRLWIEGQLVWTSGRQLKPWRADEGYRTVHFRKGLNRILCRVENGWKETRYSLLICMKPVKR